VRDATSWVDYTSELAFWVDGASGNYYQKTSATISGTNLLSISMVMAAPVAQADLFTAWGPPGLTGSSLFLATSGTLLGYFWNNSTFKSASFPNTGLDDGAWHCLTIVLDGRTADAAKLWVDGTEIVAAAQNLDETPGIAATTTLKSMGTGGALRSAMARWTISETAATLADHQAFCGDLWQAPAGGLNDTKPLSADDTWTQTAGVGCWPTSSTTAVCVPGGLQPYTVDATGIGWPVQQAIVNPVLYSTAMDCTNWTCSGAASATYGKIAPDGSATASEITVAVGANHFEQDIVAGYTANASPLYLGMWLDCSSGLIHPHGSNDGTRGDWDISCGCIGGQWTYVDRDHPCVVVQTPFNADGSGNSGLHIDGTVVVDATVWAPTLTEQHPWSRVVIPTGASGSTLGDPIWAIANGLANTGAELIANGTMEATPLVPPWIQVNNATITQETGNPSGDGTKVMRIAYNAVSIPQAGQTATEVGQTYRAIGWARADGTYIWLVRDGGTNIVVGTASSTWAQFDITYVAGSTSFRLVSAATGAGWAEFDDVSVFKQEPYGDYYREGDTVLQSLSQYSGTCFAVPGTDILLAGSPTCSGTWYGLRIYK
jgi:hypothetical protein